MAIDPIKRVTILSPGKSPRGVLRALHRLGLVEVTDASKDILGRDLQAKKQLQEAEQTLHRTEVTTDQTDEKLRQIEFILNLLNLLVPEQESFIRGLTPLPLVVDQRELDETVQEFDLAKAHTAARELDDWYRRTERMLSEVRSQLATLGPLEDLPFNVPDLARPTRFRLIIGYLPASSRPMLDAAKEPWSFAAWETIKPAYLLRRNITPEEVRRAEEEAEQSDPLRIVFAVLREHEEAFRRALAGLGFEEITLPALPGKVHDQMCQLRGGLVEYEDQLKKAKEKARELAAHRRSLHILKAFWTSVRRRQVAAANALHGKWIHLLSGYIRTKDMPRLEAAMQREFPHAVVLFEDPAPDEDVPVSLSLPYALRPITLLVQMFGLPPYRAFDPSPFILVNFYLFFGICFSDVGYGLMQVLFSAYLARKTRDYPGVNNLARMLFYAGLSTMVFGALLGSWFGDLYKPEFLGEGNVLQSLQASFVVLDPLAKTMHALVIALLIGMLNQFYGIALKMYGALRRRDYATAVCDGLLWLITLPGLVILASTLFVTPPAPVFRVGVWMFLGGALGLVFTQGRSIKNPVGRLLAGVVSIYGIIGSYGCTAFVGDVLSYCRLLALGLTTGIVASTFNMMAGMVRDTPFVGMVLFLGVLAVGHVFNFGISLLGAFVHSMRLVFVEFFGRFYEGGARPFEPLGVDSPQCVVRKPVGQHS